MGDTPRSQTISTQLQQIAEQARRHPDYTFTTLAHLMDVEWLKEAYRRTRKDAAPGVDRVTAQDYAEQLEENLQALHARLVSGDYRPTPVKRAWLEKEDGRLRPIGIPAFEDKLVQRAVVMLLSAVYEQDFYDFSHGFREGHSPHQALHELREWCMEKQVGWIVDADISGFFDSLSHQQLEEILQRRITDGTLLRLIGKWLKAGIQDRGEMTYPEKGTPQGSVISPLLANVFLHQVLDEWFEQEVKPRLRGRAYLIRYADDFVIACELESDARRLMQVLPKRFGRYGLQLHPTKTQLIAFQKPSAKDAGGARKRTFDFLGFTHYWTKSRKGNQVIKRQTARKRLKRALSAIWDWCRTHYHLPMTEQYRILCQKLRGHFQYYGIRGNYRMLEKVYRFAEKAWRHWLSRRSQKGAIPWERFDVFRVLFPLPKPKIVHPAV
jgi:RNA-directed DNA polymerase